MVSWCRTSRFAFAGICPGVPYGEIARIKPEMIYLDAGIIHISAEVSKVREPRKTVIQPNLVAWLLLPPSNAAPPQRTDPRIGSSCGW